MCPPSFHSHRAPLATNHYSLPAADTIAFPIELPVGVGSTSNAFLSDNRWPAASAPTNNPYWLTLSNWNWNTNYSNRVALYTTHPMCVNPIGYANPNEFNIPLPPQSQAQADLHWGAPVSRDDAEHSSSKANTDSDSSSDSGSEYTRGEGEPQSYVSRRLYEAALKQRRKRKRSSGAHTLFFSLSTSAMSVTSASGCASTASRTETADTALAAASAGGSVSGPEEASDAASASLVSAAPGASLKSAAPAPSNVSGGIDQPDGAASEADEKEPCAAKQDSLRTGEAEAEEQKPPMSYVALIACAILSRPGARLWSLFEILKLCTP